eukprot:5967624-Pleurochrysis_carterae.AAC.1
MVMCGQSVSEVEGSKFFDAAQREESVGVVGSSAGSDRCAFGLAVCKLRVVEIHGFAPGLVIAEVEVRPDVYERHELLALGHERVVGVTRIRERLASRVAVAWFSVHRLVMSEPAGTLILVKSVARPGRSASAAVVGRALVLGVQGSAGQLGLAFGDGELAL